MDTSEKTMSCITFCLFSIASAIILYARAPFKLIGVVMFGIMCGVVIIYSISKMRAPKYEKEKYEAIVPASSTSIPLQKGAKFCSVCGNEINSDTKFCLKCGKRLRD